MRNIPLNKYGPTNGMRRESRHSFIRMCIKIRVPPKWWLPVGFLKTKLKTWVALNTVKTTHPSLALLPGPPGQLSNPSRSEGQRLQVPKSAFVFDRHWCVYRCDWGPLLERKLARNQHIYDVVRFLCLETPFLVKLPRTPRRSVWLMIPRFRRQLLLVKKP